ncbi:MlaD family protein [Rhodopila sp.]|uniref:MlaD family protein n=1 Tax=Rhodopila sp. TaxID=2480087 RepID=UPI003D0BEDBD
MNASKQAAVGAFVLGGIVLALAAIVLFGNFALFNPSIRAAIVFQNSIAGLSIGAPVTFRGVRVGAVESIGIEFDPKTSVAYIPVTVRLEPGHALVTHTPSDTNVDLPALINRGLRAELNVQSFVTGQSQIDLDFDPTSAPVLHPDIASLPEIPTRQSTLQKAQEQLSQLPLRDLADNATATLQSLRGLAEKLDKDLPPLVESLTATSNRSSQTVDTTNQAIRDLQARLDSTLGSIGQLASSGDQQLNQRGAELHTLLDASNQTMVQVRDLMGDVRGLTSNRAASRANLESTLRDLAAAAASLRGFANDVEHNPQLLLTGRRP